MGIYFPGLVSNCLLQAHTPPPPPAIVAELDMVQQRNEKGRSRPRARKQPPPATELVQDTAGELDGEDPIPRTTRQSKQGSGARGKGKGKGKEKA